MKNMRLLVVLITIGVLALAACAGDPEEQFIPAQPGGDTQPKNEAVETPATGNQSESPTDVSAGEQPLSATVEPAYPAPSSEDESNLQRGNANILERDLQLSSSPKKVELNLSGSMPNPCHSLKWIVDGPDDQSRIEVEVYTLVDPTEDCIQVLESFEESIDITKVLNLAPGNFTLLVNGEQVGSFTITSSGVYP